MPHLLSLTLVLPLLCIWVGNTNCAQMMTQDKVLTTSRRPMCWCMSAVTNICFPLTRAEWEIAAGSRTTMRCDVNHHLILLCYELMARYDVLVAEVQRHQRGREMSSCYLVVTVLQRESEKEQDTCPKNTCSLLWVRMFNLCFKQKTEAHNSHCFVLSSAVYRHQILCCSPPLSQSLKRDCLYLFNPDLGTPGPRPS